MRGVNTQVCALKISTDWATDLNKNPDTRGAAPYFLIILVNLQHTACVLARFWTNAGQSLSATETTCPKYLKEVTISRGHPYVMKTLDVTTLCSSADRRHLFCSTPFLYCAVHQ